MAPGEWRASSTCTTSGRWTSFRLTDPPPTDRSISRRRVLARSIRASSNGFPAAVAARARKIRVLLMDVDGVLTAGEVYLMPLADGTAVEMEDLYSQNGARVEFG